MAKLPFAESEAVTRKTRIDGRLRSLGWKIVPHSAAFVPAIADGVAVEEYPTNDGPADYALFVSGRILGIVEAKKVKPGRTRKAKPPASPAAPKKA